MSRLPEKIGCRASSRDFVFCEFRGQESFSRRAPRMKAPVWAHVPIHVPKRSKSTEFSMTADGEKIGQVIEKIGGASRDRTDDLIVANDALSQLSYSPHRMAG